MWYQIKLNATVQVNSPFEFPVISDSGWSYGVKGWWADCSALVNTPKGYRQCSIRATKEEKGWKLCGNHYNCAVDRHHSPR